MTQSTKSAYRCYRYRDDRACTADRKGVAPAEDILAWAKSFDEFHGTSVQAAVRFLNQADGRLIGVTKLSKREAIQENGYYAPAAFAPEHGTPATYADRIRADREAERERAERIISAPGYGQGDDPDAEIAAAYEARNDDALDDVFATSTTTKESEHTVENKYSPFDADAATDAEGRPLFASDPEPEGPAYSNPEADALGVTLRN